jgi:mycofactocin system transcriptional regulator
MSSTFRRVGLDNVIEVAIIWHRVPKWKGVAMRRPVSEHRVGRRRSTTTDHISNVAIDLFTARGFDEVSVDDVAEAAGIARRTLFRYYPSKNALPWGDFDAHLDHMRDLLNELDPDVPVEQAFNSFDAQETARHRQRMRVILETAALQAYSMTMYAGWRAVVAAFVAQRLGAKVEDIVPRTVAWTMLGVALSAYEHWLADESVSLAQALGEAFDTVRPGLDRLDRS